MILDLRVELFESPTVDERRLLRRVIQIASDDLRHVVGLLPSGVEVDEASLFQACAASWSPDEVEEISLLLEQSALLRDAMPHESSHRTGCWRRPGVLKVEVERRASSDWRTLRLTLRDTLDLLLEPVHLHLEDRFNDFKFLLWLAEPEGRRELSCLERAPNRIQVHGEPTGTLERWLAPLARRETLSGEECRRLWRSWVMFDRDASEHDARGPSASIERLIEHCEEIWRKHGIPLSWVCLQRREIESYLPDDALNRAQDRQRREAAKALREWRRRGDRQEWAWAYDMKNGLVGDLVAGISKERRREIRDRRTDLRPGEVKPPFDTLDAAKRRALAYGFGESVLNGALARPDPPHWLEDIGAEYERGPAHQLPRTALLQSIFDRM